MSAPLFVLCLALSLHAGLSMESLKAEDGYEVFPSMPGSRYKHVTTLHLEWAQALSSCQSDGEGSLLAVINSEVEAEVVKEFMVRVANTSYPYAWVGINDLAAEGQWVTVQGDLLTEAGYDSWGGGYPNGGTTYNCGFVYGAALYRDYRCTSLRPFICEKTNV